MLGETLIDKMRDKKRPRGGGLKEEATEKVVGGWY
jgi:hypothetical protein